jgi:hypothetical protein
MMDLMSLPDPEKVRIRRFEGFKAVMYKPIMEDEVNNAVYGNSRAYPETCIQRFPACPHQIQRDRPEKNTENIIQLKPRRMRLMVRLMNKPQRTVEKILVNKP